VELLIYTVFVMANDNFQIWLPRQSCETISVA